MKKISIMILFVLAVCGFAYAADPFPVNFDWKDSETQDPPGYTLFTELNPSQDETFYSLSGRIVSDNGFTYPVSGGVVYGSQRDKFMVSFFYTSATGEHFMFGAAVDPVTLCGDGNLQRVAHGSVGADDPGILCVVP